MKRYILTIIAILSLPVCSFSFSLVGSPVEVPKYKEYIIYNKTFENKSLPNNSNAEIDTSILIYNIQAQVTKTSEMFYIKDDQLHEFKDSSWAMPASKMLTVALFEYLLDHNVVTRLAFQDINIRQDFTLSGTTPYGPIADLDNKQFYFYITFYLKNEKTNATQIKTIKYEKALNDGTLTADKYVELTNSGLSHIFKRLRPWLVSTLKSEKYKNENMKTKQPSLAATLAQINN